MRWWRAYESALDDPKVQKLPGELFKAWFNLLCLASRGDGRLPPIADIAFALRKPEDETAQILADLEARSLIDADEAGFAPHNWVGRQYKSDGSTERVKRFRKRRRNVSETPSESESESESESDTESVSDQCVSAGRAMPITESWQPSEGALARLRKGRPDVEGAFYEQRLREFRLWCRANATTSHDPEATWMSFMLRSRAPPAPSAQAADWRVERAAGIELAIAASKRFGT